MVEIKIDEDEKNYRFKVKLNEFEETYVENSIETLRNLTWKDFKEYDNTFDNQKIDDETRLISLEIEKEVEYEEIENLIGKLNQYIDKRIVKNS